VLLTGAAGRIGSAFRVYAADRYAFRFGIHPSERIDDAGGHDVMPFDIVDLEACQRACAGIDTVVHMAADPSRKSDFYASLLDANIRGVYNIFRAAKDRGCQRVICASSIQAVEGYPADEVIYPHSAARPVNMYGVTKCFAEAVAHCFAYSEGLSSIAVRIGTFESERLCAHFSRRNLRTFVSRDDLCQLLVRCIETPGVLFAIAHGASNNRVKRLDLAETTALFGYQPQDDAFRIAEENGQHVQTEACIMPPSRAAALRRAIR
jgi:nucleoside-diphosphate-sugar epimerase